MGKKMTSGSLLLVNMDHPSNPKTPVKRPPSSEARSKITVLLLGEVPGRYDR